MNDIFEYNNHLENLLKQDSSFLKISCYDQYKRNEKIANHIDKFLEEHNKLKQKFENEKKEISFVYLSLILSFCLLFFWQWTFAFLIIIVLVWFFLT